MGRISSHGGDIYSHKVELDFSANLNPLGIPNEIRKAVIEADFEHYPDTECAKLVSAVSEYEGISPDKIVCGNGAADIIFRIAGALKPKRALLCVPTFSEYEKALLENECAVSYHFLCEENGFELTESCLSQITPDLNMLFLCSPNNPVGSIIPLELIERIIKQCREYGITAVVDECFLEFAENGLDYSAKQFLCDNVIVVKAFTKICAMAGLRVGYAVFGSTEKAEAVRGFGQPWSVSSPAQAGGTAAARLLKNTDFIAETVRLVSAERKYLAESLSRLGVKVFNSKANFLLLKSETDIAEILGKQGIEIRRCNDYYGLGGEYFRIAVRTHSENERLVSVLENALIK